MRLLNALPLLALLALAILPACQTTSESRIITTDPAYRQFSGTIISLRPPTSVMLISKGKSLDDLNIVECKWNAQTRFTLDGKPAALDEIRPYMPVTIQGRMIDDQLVVAEAQFSSALPANVRPTTQP